MEKQRDSFIFYRSFYEAISDLSTKGQLEVYQAIASYSLNFQEKELSGLPKTIFKLIKPQLNANNKRFLNGTQGADHGKKGGRPKKPLDKPLDKPQKNPKKTPSLTPNNNVNVNDNVNNNIKIPGFIKADLWNGYLEARKKKPTNQAIKLIVDKVTKWKNKGLDPNEALKNSIENGWTGLFEPKQNKSQSVSTMDLDLS